MSSTVNITKDKVIWNNKCMDINIFTNKLFYNSMIKGIQAVRIDFFSQILKVANIRCFILIAVEIFHNTIRK